MTSPPSEETVKVLFVRIIYLFCNNSRAFLKKAVSLL